MKQALLNLTCAGVGALIVLGALQWMPSYGDEERARPQLRVEDTPVSRETKFTTSFAPIIKKAAPSVVNIFSTRRVSSRELRGMNPLWDHPLFREFFGDPDEMPQRNRQEESLGSGVIVSTDGYILTSNHVIEGADEVKIVMTSGRQFTAEVVGTDPPTDTAVLKVDATELPAVTIANSDKIEVGDVVLAIGNPCGIGQTVTMGIVSATRRGTLGIVDYEDFIQTDASINPGNSGGALVDAEGRLVGINTAILSRTGGNMGVGFAIPINMGRYVMEQLIGNGKVSRGFLGVGLQPITPDLANRLQLENMRGALVSQVEEGTPAAEAGFKPYDVIVEYNGREVSDSQQLRLMVSQTAPRTKVTFKVMRDGKPKNFNVTLAELSPEQMARMGRPAPQEAEENEALAGVEVTDLDAQARRQYGVPNHIRGALVTGVEQNSAAAREGLRPGDVILEIERRNVASAEEAVRMTEGFEGDRIMLRIWSRGGTRIVSVPVESGSDEEDEDAR